ncbi:MAG: hypothetical protein JWO27_971 [Frankiales bacterium]|nr:hypothetical protein [Frankiales bacterium]
MTSPTGYSGTPLPQKLGIKAGARVLLDGAPDGFDLGPLPDGVTLSSRAASSYDLALVFVKDSGRLAKRWAAVHPRVTPAGRLWVAWPKRSSGVPTDLDEGVVREHGLTHGRVDVKVCAVDATWSGLAFVVRLQDRRRP